MFFLISVTSLSVGGRLVTLHPTPWLQHLVTGCLDIVYAVNLDGDSIARSSELVQPDLVACYVYNVEYPEAMKKTYECFHINILDLPQKKTNKEVSKLSVKLLAKIYYVFLFHYFLKNNTNLTWVKCRKVKVFKDKII